MCVHWKGFRYSTSKPFQIIISIFYLITFLTFLTFYFISEESPHSTTQNITIFRNISVLQDEFSPSISSFFLFRKPIHFFPKPKVIYIKGSEHYILADIAFTSPVLYTMKNTIASTDNVFIYNKSIYIFDHSCHDKYINYTDNNSRIDAITLRYESYDSVISIGHQFSTDFGHWLIETLPMFAAIPLSIRNKSKLLLPKKSIFVTSALEFFNFNLSNVIYGQNAYAYGQKVYTIYSANCGRINQWLICNFRAIVIEKLKLDKLTPTKYVLFNRKKGYSRRIANFNKLFYSVEQINPEIKFEKGIFYDTFEKQVIYFNQIRLVFGIHGAVLANIVFMQENTVVVEMQMEIMKTSFYYCAVLTGKNFVVCRDSSISYRGKKPNIINIDIAIEAITKALNIII